jgi:nitrogen fixation NifU-like protein
MYSAKAMEHFFKPHNIFVMTEPDGVGISRNCNCGDNLKMFIQVQEGMITNISFLVFGCGAAIACGSMTTTLAEGKSIEDALKITEQEVIDALDGLPEHKRHCSNLGVSALRAAIEDYQAKKTKNAHSPQE